MSLQAWDLARDCLCLLLLPQRWEAAAHPSKLKGTGLQCVPIHSLAAGSLPNLPEPLGSTQSANKDNLPESEKTQEGCDGCQSLSCVTLGKLLSLPEPQFLHL